ncbi:MAG TPA: DUF882 domain-containing protein [bacterium]|nr:DUF882 domain-containing protein [bacterium]
MKTSRNLVPHFVIFVLFLLFCPEVRAGSDHSLSLPHDGHLRIFAYHVGEYLDVTYLDQNGDWDHTAYVRLNFLLRSRGDDQTTQMDKRLIELADHLQDHFKTDGIEIISGYRSPEFNQELREQGHRVAEESYHTKGMALDVHLDEIREDVLRDYLLSLKLGGVGYYGDRLMVHMDFGPLREWHSGDFSENTKIGVFNDKNRVRITTDKFYYALADPQNLVFEGIEPVAGHQMQLQKFLRGQWQDVTGVVLFGHMSSIANLQTLMSSVVATSPYGKFRWQWRHGEAWQNSNEFYIKK